MSVNSAPFAASLRQAIASMTGAIARITSRTEGTMGRVLCITRDLNLQLLARSTPTVCVSPTWPTTDQTDYEAFVVDTKLLSPADWARLRRYSRGAGRAPIVLIDADDTAREDLARVAVDELLSDRHDGAALITTLRKLDRESRLIRCAGRIIEDLQISGPLQQILLLCAEQPHNFPTISTMAVHLQVSDRTIRRHWRAAVGGPVPRLDAVLRVFKQFSAGDKRRCAATQLIDALTGNPRYVRDDNPAGAVIRIVAEHLLPGTQVIE